MSDTGAHEDFLDMDGMFDEAGAAAEAEAGAAAETAATETRNWGQAAAAGAAAGAGAGAGAAVGSAISDRLLPHNRHQVLSWSVVFENPGMFTTLLAIVQKVVGKLLPLTVQVEEAPGGGGALVGGMFVQTVVHTMIFLSAYLPCAEVVLYGAARTGYRDFAVDMDTFRGVLGGALTSVALFQNRAAAAPASASASASASAAADSDLHIVMSDATGGGAVHLPTDSVADEEAFMKDALAFEFICEMSMPVELLRFNLDMVGKMADENVIVEVCDLGRGSLLLLLRGEGSKGSMERHVTMTQVPVPAAPTAPAFVTASALKASARHKCTLATGPVWVPNDTRRLPRMFSNRFNIEILKKMLHSMRSESVVDVFVGDGATTGGGGSNTPIMIRLPLEYLHGGYIAFALAPAAPKME